MAFGGNTAPKRRIKATAAWFCELCDREVKRYHNHCPSCGVSRPVE